MSQMKPKSASNAVAVFDGYVDGVPLVMWRDRRDMPQLGEKLYTGRARDRLLEIIAAAYQIAAKHSAPARVLDILADPDAASADQIALMLPYQVEAHDVEAELEAGPRYCKPKHFEGIDAERQKFEAWATGPSGPWRPGALERDEDGYISTEVREHWSMWANFAVRRVAEGSDAPAAARTSAIDDVEVSALLNDLERVGARGTGEIPGLCTWAGTVIRGLRSKQDAEQLP